jgi:hypothetical protein
MRVGKAVWGSLVMEKSTRPNFMLQLEKKGQSQHLLMKPNHENKVSY